MKECASPTAPGASGASAALEVGTRAPLQTTDPTLIITPRSTAKSQNHLLKRNEPVIKAHERFCFKKVYFYLKKGG